MFFSAYRRAIRERRKAEADRDFWKDRALELQDKLDARSDFFIEREFRLLDRVLTKHGTYAITDQVRGESRAAALDESEAKVAARQAYLEDQKQFYIQCAQEAGATDPYREAEITLQRDMGRIESEFEADYRARIIRN